MILTNNNEEFTKNEIVAFENQYLQAFQQLAQITKRKRELEETEKNMKKVLEKVMDENNIKSIDNQYIKVTKINSSTSTSIDLKKLEKEEPKLYEELLEDYQKVTNKAAYVRFLVKE